MVSALKTSQPNMLKVSDRTVPKVCGYRKWFMNLFMIKGAYILVT